MSVNVFSCRAYYKDSHVVDKCETESCKLNYICDFVTGNTADLSHCDRFKVFLAMGPTTTEPPNGAGMNNYSASILLFGILFSFYALFNVVL